MLMTNELTEQQAALLEIIRAGDGWLSRKDIAVQQGKSRLNKWDTQLLDRLIDMGLIEVSKRDFPGLIGFEFVYRAVN